MPASTPAVAAVGSGLPAAGLGQTAFALLAVIALIFALAWLLRRVQGMRPGGRGALQLQGGLQVGTRERVLLLKAGETHLLIGVAPGRVQTLHVFDKPPVGEADATAAPQAPNFSELLNKALGRETRS